MLVLSGKILILTEEYGYRCDLTYDKVILTTKIWNFQKFTFSLTVIKNFIYASISDE